jgi:glutamine amidotransferase
MCRWIAYQGKQIFIDELVTVPIHSLVEQSLNTKLNLKDDGSIWSTNGDGFGVGWYSRKEEPGLFKDSMPAWNDKNLHEICSQIKAHIFFSHVRASTNGGVQRSNSHPFKYENWLFQHNGDIDNFLAIKKDAQFEITPEFFNKIEGTTDSETFFYLALTYGLLTNPKAAIERTIVKLEELQKKAGVEVSINLSCSISDGKKLYTVRYGSGSKPARTQFYSTDMSCVKELNATCNIIPEGGVIVVSEPLDHHGENWTEVPQNSFLEIEDGKVNLQKLTFN